MLLRWLDHALQLRLTGVLCLLVLAMPCPAQEEKADSTRRPAAARAAQPDSLPMPPAGAQGARADSLPRPPAGAKDGESVWPYRLVDYAQISHDYRIMNATAIVLGRIESVHTVDYTEKDRTSAAWLRVETFLLTDRPGQEEADSILFRFAPLMESFKKPFAAGDRCLLLLGRDLRHDNALILPTDMDYYPVTPEGKVQKFMKTGPSKDDPVLEEVSLTAFLDEIRQLLKRVSLEEQARACELVMTGEVVENRQGLDSARDYFYVTIKPDRIFKGQLDGDTVTFIQRANPARWIIPALNRATFRAGDRALCFGNKDPTYSTKGIWNPEGETLYVFPFERISSLFLASDTAWRRGFQPIPLDQLYADLARWTGSDGETKH